MVQCSHGCRFLRVTSAGHFRVFLCLLGRTKKPASALLRCFRHKKGRNQFLARKSIDNFHFSSPFFQTPGAEQKSKKSKVLSRHMNRKDVERKNVEDVGRKMSRMSTLSSGKMSRMSNGKCRECRHCQVEKCRGCRTENVENVETVMWKNVEDVERKLSRMSTLSSGKMSRMSNGKCRESWQKIGRPWADHPDGGRAEHLGEDLHGLLHDVSGQSWALEVFLNQWFFLHFFSS